jgi:alpha-acetolactate decarboxylase
MPVTMKAKFDKDSLKVSRSSTFNGPMGEMTVSNKETYTLSADGKTLTVKRESESPRGSFSSESTYKKATESPKM